MGGTSTRSSSRAKKTYLRVVQIIQITNRPLRTPRMDEPAITFMDKDARMMRHHPHDDVIVINFMIGNYTTRRVLVDNGSLVESSTT